MACDHSEGVLRREGGWKLHGQASLRWQPRGSGTWVEAITHAAADQSRVADTRGERPTGGYATFDLHAGVEITEGATVRLGVDNLTDRWYVNALNARNPFTGAAIAEPGRGFFVRTSFAF